MSTRSPNTFRWRGAQSSAWNNGLNWVDQNCTVYAANEYPGYDGSNSANVNGDTVILDAAPTNALAGYDASTRGQLASFKVTSAYNTTIGASASNPLILSLQNSGTANIDGSNAGNIFLRGAGNGISGISTQGTKSGSAITLDGTIGDCTFFAGNIAIAATAVVSNSLQVSCLTTPMTDVTLTIASGATLPATVIATGGKVTCNTALQTLMHLNGSWTQTADVNELDQNGGTFVWNGGNIGTLNLNVGTVDASQAPAVTRNIGNATIGKQGTLNLSGTGGNVSWGEIQINNGTITYPAGQIILSSDDAWKISSSRFRGTTWKIETS
jgi:hypothetical protein